MSPPGPPLSRLQRDSHGPRERKIGPGLKGDNSMPNLGVMAWVGHATSTCPQCIAAWPGRSFWQTMSSVLCCRAGSLHISLSLPLTFSLSHSLSLFQTWSLSVLHHCLLLSLLFILLRLSEAGHAGGGQVQDWSGAAVACWGLDGAHAAARGEAGHGGDAARLGPDAAPATGRQPPLQAGWARLVAQALGLALQEVGQHLTFALYTDFAPAHQVVVDLQHAVDVLSHLFNK